MGGVLVAFAAAGVGAFCWLLARWAVVKPLVRRSQRRDFDRREAKVGALLEQGQITGATAERELYILRKVRRRTLAEQRADKKADRSAGCKPRAARRLADRCAAVQIAG